MGSGGDAGPARAGPPSPKYLQSRQWNDAPSLRTSSCLTSVFLQTKVQRQLASETQQQWYLVAITRLPKMTRVHRTQTVTQSSSFRILLHFIYYIRRELCFVFFLFCFVFVLLPMQLTQQWSMEMSVKSRDPVKASLCDDKTDQIVDILFLLHITRSQRRQLKCTIILKYLVMGPLPHTLYFISHRYCHALHILTANLCHNILHIKKKESESKTFPNFFFGF